jgi:hypothetical protein
MPKRFLVFIALCCPLLANAADFSAGFAAYEKGDYAAGLREFRLAAAQGDVDAQYKHRFDVPQCLGRS